MATGYSLREVARMLKIPEQRIRDFVRAGILSADNNKTASKEIKFDFRDMLVLRMAMRLISNGLSSRRVKKSFILLQNQIRNDLPLSGVQLFAESGKVIASDGHTLWEPESGQQRLRFDVFDDDEHDDGQTAQSRKYIVNKNITEQKNVTKPELNTPINADGLPASADGWFDVAMQLEDFEPHRAYEAYLKALEANPEHVDAYINVGRLCSTAGEFNRAAAFFRQAIRVDPTHPVAHFNLAVTLHDIGELEPAREAYRDAIAHDPYFADAHYNLAALLEQMGDHDGAIRHRQLYDAVIHQPG
ncbi:MAG: tetratricopeptide repeat protein [Deltaproteobacteria bacterium]|nr:tetratricopeptide repeat protein [Deltaproteobacteria bacterium]